MKGKALLISAAKRKEICVFKWHIYSVSTQEQPNQNGILTFDSRDNICWCFGATWDPWNEYNFIMEARGDWIIDDYVSFACIFRMEEAQKNLASTKSRWRYWTCIPESKSNPYKTLFLFIRFIFLRQHLCVFKEDSQRINVLRMWRRNLSWDRLSTASIRLHAENGTNSWLCLRE